MNGEGEADIQSPYALLFQTCDLDYRRARPPVRQYYVCQRNWVFTIGDKILYFHIRTFPKNMEGTLEEAYGLWFVRSAGCRFGHNARMTGIQVVSMQQNALLITQPDDPSHVLLRLRLRTLSPSSPAVMPNIYSFLPTLRVHLEVTLTQR